jgi:hypothetical protein
VSACLVLAGVCIACGKKGPPLPPLIRVPAPPVDFSAERRGAEVALRFTVPAANTDGTRPANIERLDVLRYTGPLSATDDDVVKLGTRVASVQVKAPESPDVANEPDEPIRARSRRSRTRSMPPPPGRWNCQSRTERRSARSSRPFPSLFWVRLLPSGRRCT